MYTSAIHVYVWCRDAYRIACLGVTVEDWRLLAMEAMEVLQRGDSPYYGDRVGCLHRSIHLENPCFCSCGNKHSIWNPSSRKDTYVGPPKITKIR